jgi:hypothetical protein
VTYEDLSGIGRRHPAAALAFSLFLLSLAGVPPTAGFFAKWFVFRAAIDGGLYWLSIIAFINSVIGAYYYLRVLVYMYMREPAAGAPVAVPMRSGTSDLPGIDAKSCPAALDTYGKLFRAGPAAGRWAQARGRRGRRRHRLLGLLHSCEGGSRASCHWRQLRLLRENGRDDVRAAARNRQRFQARVRARALWGPTGSNHDRSAITER